MSDFISQIPENVRWFFVCMILFTLLARLFACNKSQPFWHAESFTNILYYFIPPFLYRVALPMVAWFLLFVVYFGKAEKINGFALGQGIPSHWPILLQLAGILLISDIIQYWIHRWFHMEQMWRFHSIHHSPKIIDWLVANRFHPVNVILYSTLTAAITYLLGFSLEAFALLVPFNILYSGMVHANLNWTFGPFKYVFASPVFHRWHHTFPDEGGNKNFAPTFPFLDVMFGTFYMPEDRLPEKYGVEEPVPNDFIGQMIYPFKKR